MDRTKNVVGANSLRMWKNAAIASLMCNLASLNEAGVAQFALRQISAQ
jgi:hypothetical protein